MTYATCSHSPRLGALRRLSLAALALALPLTALPAASAPPRFTPGAAGVGDRYFPRDGNGGYDVRRYVLDLDYSPADNRLSGLATLRARAVKNLSRFNLDLDGMTVHRVTVNGKAAGWHRRHGELVVDPAGRGLRQGHRFRVTVRYSGVPRSIHDAFGVSGVFDTDDGMTIAGQPHVAATWFPVNDHPTDKAAYTFRISVPRGRQVVANGVLTARRREGARTTWTWTARAPMASYLATVNVGRFVLTRYRQNGIVFQDAIDPDLLEAPARPRSGKQFAIGGRADSGYKRLTHRIDVPARGGSLSFWVDRDTERQWDFFFVEAHTVGAGDWTTLPDSNGHTSPSTGNSCPGWLGLHPFLEHYQTAKKNGSCAPHGSSGVWRAATGASHGYEQWSVDLDRYAGKTIDVSLTQTSDDFVQIYGAFVDDITAPRRQGSTSFEDDRDVMDGWTVPGPPPSSPGNTNDWTVGTVDDTPLPFGVRARRSFQREPEILSFLSRRFGDYPFRVSGGIADDDRRLQFALETQTRPVYSLLFFTDQPGANGVVVHELAHQWYGDSVALRRWRDIWLNEGFATYAEWLWTEHVGGPSPQRTFRQTYRSIPGKDPFWDLRIGNPGRKALFDNPVYLRGAMTLQRLRTRVGDETFFRILRRWAATQAGGNVTTREFVRFAERLSGRDLAGLFHTWLFVPRKPRLPGLAAPLQPTKEATAVSRASRVAAVADRS